MGCKGQPRRLLEQVRHFWLPGTKKCISGVVELAPLPRSIQAFETRPQKAKDKKASVLVVNAASEGDGWDASNKRTSQTRKQTSGCPSSAVHSPVATNPRANFMLCSQKCAHAILPRQSEKGRGGSHDRCPDTVRR